MSWGDGVPGYSDELRHEIADLTRERDELRSTASVQRTRLKAASEALDHLAAFLDYALPGDKHVAMLRVCLPPERAK